MTSVFGSLRVRNYRLFAGGQIVSNTGAWVQRVAQDWLVLELTHNSGTALGITTALQFLPMLLFGLWGGVIADRYPKRRILMCTNVAMSLLALSLGLLTVTGAVEAWHVYAIAFGLGVVTVVDNPTRQAFVSEMVGIEHLSNAVGLNSATFNLARIAGPAVAGVMINVIGTGPLFMFNACTYFAVITGLLLMRERELHRIPAAEKPRAGSGLKAGLVYVRDRPALLLPIVIVGFVGMFGLNFQITNALYATRVFHLGASSYGMLSSAVAVGSLTGALLAASRRRPTRTLLVGAATLFGVFEVIAALMPSYWAFMAMLVPIGLASLTMMTAANTIVQMTSSPAMRGRVMAIYLLVFMGGTPIGAPTIGWIADQVGARWSLLLGGGVSALAAIVATLVVARVDGTPIRRSLRAAGGAAWPIHRRRRRQAQGHGQPAAAHRRPTGTTRRPEQPVGERTR